MPGPRWHLPYPIEAAELVDFSQVRTVEVGYRNTPKNKSRQGSRDADRRREHHRHRSSPSSTTSRAPRITSSTTGTRTDRLQVAEIGDPRGRRQEQDGLRAVRGTRADRQADRTADAADARPLPDGCLRAEGDPAERAAARAGAGSVRRCGQGRPGPRATQERGPGLRQRRRPARTRRGGTPARGGQRLSAEVVQRRRAMPSASARSSASTRRRRESRASACTSTRCSPCSATPARCSSTRRAIEPALPAARQADPAIGGGCGPGPCRGDGCRIARHHARTGGGDRRIDVGWLDPSRSRDALRNRESR